MSTDSAMKLLIRADGGPRVGTGHVMRCLALGQAWRKTGGAVHFITGPLPGRLAKRLTDNGFQHYEIDAPDECSDAYLTREFILANNPDWVVLDGYRFDDQYQQILALDSNISKLMVIDDFGHGHHGRADAIINQNLYANGQQYSVDTRRTDVVTGPQFALLRNEFRDTRSFQLETPVPRKARRILVTFGGADPDNVTLAALQAIERCVTHRVVIDVIVGPCNPHLESLVEFCRDSVISIRLHRQVDRMSTLFQHADLAISAAGSTCYEMCYQGIPMIVIPIAENQYPVASALKRMEIAEWINSASELSQPNSLALLRRVISDASRRSEMVRRGQQLIDGHGSGRLARRMIARLFQFRDADSNDAQLLLDWRNDPEVRSVCFQENVISYEQHCQWLESKLDSPLTRIWIVEDKSGRPVGQIRMDFESRLQAVISINLVPSFRGMGMGTALIERICRRESSNLPNLRILANIKSTNIASQAAFRKAGFVATRTTMIQGQVAIQYAYQPGTDQRLNLMHQKMAS